MEKEEWKDISGYEGLYQVSNLGRVKGLDRVVKTKNGRTQSKKGMVLKNKLGTSGYHYVILYKDNKPKTIMNHTLVAYEFIGERPEGNDICHIDGDRFNNKLINLRYDTRAENFIDVYRVGKKNPNGKLTIDEVLEIRRLRKERSYTYAELSKKFNISESQISAIVSRKSYKWLNDDGTIQESKTALFRLEA